MKEFKSGKNRIIYDIGNGQFVIVFRNTISVGKSVFPKQIPRKGEISNRMSEFWFDQTQNDFPNHMISTDNSLMPKLFQEKKYSGRCMLVKKTQLLPVKCVVYGYLTGAAWEEYRNNNCIVNGKEFFPGIEESEEIGTIYMPKVTLVDGTEEDMTYEQTVEFIGEEYAQKLKSLSIELYKKCARYAKKKGIIIADTQFRFGIDEDGKLVLASEMITSDSSRFWSVEDYFVGRAQKSLDKQYLIDWLKGTGWKDGQIIPIIPERVAFETAANIIKVYEKLTGETLY